eukprot:m.604938 g.604938  ORF g.604938 m.604938 type:complete len:828 (+) comp58107_c0_seq43:34-2517(+)
MASTDVPRVEPDKRKTMLCHNIAADRCEYSNGCIMSHHPAKLFDKSAYRTFDSARRWQRNGQAQAWVVHHALDYGREIGAEDAAAALYRKVLQNPANPLKRNEYSKLLAELDKPKKAAETVVLTFDQLMTKHAGLLGAISEEEALSIPLCAFFARGYCTDAETAGHLSTFSHHPSKLFLGCPEFASTLSWRSLAAQQWTLKYLHARTDEDAATLYKYVLNNPIRELRELCNGILKVRPAISDPAKVKIREFEADAKKFKFCAMFKEEGSCPRGDSCSFSHHPERLFVDHQTFSSSQAWKNPDFQEWALAYGPRRLNGDQLAQAVRTHLHPTLRSRVVELTKLGETAPPVRIRQVFKSVAPASSTGSVGISRSAPSAPSDPRRLFSDVQDLLDDHDYLFADTIEATENLKLCEDFRKGFCLQADTEDHLDRYSHDPAKLFKMKPEFVSTKSWRTLDAQKWVLKFALDKGDAGLALFKAVLNTPVEELKEFCELVLDQHPELVSEINGITEFESDTDKWRPCAHLQKSGICNFYSACSFSHHPERLFREVPSFDQSPAWRLPDFQEWVLLFGKSRPGGSELFDNVVANLDPRLRDQYSALLEPSLRERKLDSLDAKSQFLQRPGGVSWRDFISAVKQGQTFRTIDLRSTPWEEEEGSPLVETITAATVSLVADALLTCGARVIELNLEGNQIGASGAAVLCRALRTMTNLEQLNLSGNFLEDEGVGHLCQALPTMKALQSLRLSANTVRDGGLKQLQDALSRLPRLKSLDLSWNDFENEGLGYLRTALTNSSAQWATLDLTGNYFQDADVYLGALRRAVQNLVIGSDFG